MGKAIDIVGKGLGDPFGQGWNISENLESWGGSPTGSKWTFVKPAKAAETVDWSQYQSPAIDSGNNTGSVLGEGTSNNINDTGGNTGGSLRDAFNAYRASGGYAGWDEGPAWADFQAKGGNVSGGGSGESSGPSAEELLRQRLMNSVSSGYDAFINELDKLAGNIGPWLQERKGQLENLFGSQVNELDVSKAGALAKFPGYEQNIRTQKKQSVRDIAENLRNILQAGNTYLGQYGASSSGANTLLKYALGREAGKQTGLVARQAQQMFADLDQKKIDIKNTFDQQRAQLGTWKAEQLGKITDWYNSLKQQIAGQRANAVGEKAQALAAAETQLLQNALSKLSQLEQQANNWEATMKDWAINRYAQIDDMKMKLGQLGQYTPQQIVHNELQGISGIKGPTMAGGYSPTNPYYLLKKKKEEEVQNLY